MPKTIEALRRDNLSANLSVVRRRWPAIAQMVSQGGTASEYLLRSTPDGLPTLLVRRGEDYQWYHSQYAPEQEAADFVAQCAAEEASLVVCLGLGLGYHVKALLPKLLADTPLFLVERSPELLRLFLELHDWSSILALPDVHLICGEYSPQQMTAVIAQYAGPDRYHKRNWVYLGWPVALKLDGDYYHGVRQLFREVVDRIRVTLATDVTISPFWRTNLWYNIEHVLKSAPVRNLANAFEGVPWIVVASGPSLEDEIPTLRQVQDRAVICSVGSAYRFLLENGITPHFVVAIDALHYNMPHFEQTGSPESFLVFDPMIYPGILRRGVEKRFVCNIAPGRTNPGMNLLTEVFGHVGWLPSGFSVSTTCLSLGVLAGARPIIFVGQDLAFRGNRSHFSSNVWCEEVDFDSYDYYEVAANDGTKARTTKGWLPILRALEQMVAQYGRPCFTTSLHGAKMAGVPFRPLAKLSEEFPEPFDVRSTIADRYELMGLCVEKIERFRLRVREEMEKLADLEALSCRLKEKTGKLLVALLGESKLKIEPLAEEIQQGVYELQKDPRMPWLESWMHEARNFLQKSKHQRPSHVSPRAWEANRAGIFFEAVSRASCSAKKLLEEGSRRLEKMEEELRAQAAAPSGVS